jgi:hypothetical protein
MASKDPKLSKEGTAGKRKHRNLKKIRNLKNGKNQRQVMASCSGGSTGHLWHHVKL